MTPLPSLLRSSCALLAAILTAGCATSSTSQHGNSILVDGDIGDWEADEAARASADYLYLRFSTGDEFSLQAAPRTVAIYIDADASQATGQAFSREPLTDFGVDLGIEFSPRRADAPGRGVVVWTASPGGRRVIRPAEIDLVVAPTYAATWYELRIARTVLADLLPPEGLVQGGRVRGVVAILGNDGEVSAWADPFSIDAAPPTAGSVGRPSGIPAPERDGVRVVSWNVERSAPLRQPDPFRRLLGALKPDVLLLQEWEEGDGAAVSAWLLDAGFSDWHVVKAEGNLATGGGVLVASRFPIAPLPGDLRLPEGGEVRFVGGIVQTPMGAMVACSAHLKCCGSKDSPEDRKRMSEARAINALLKSALGANGAPLRVVAGDMNLVGSRPPLDLLRAELDADGTDLAVADAVVFGNGCFTTWRDPDTPFPPGRLDYVVYSDATMEAVRAFTLDTTRLPDGVLTIAGLGRDDSWCSDHLPVIVDFVPAK